MGGARWVGLREGAPVTDREVEPGVLGGTDSPMYNRQVFTSKTSELVPTLMISALDGQSFLSGKNTKICIRLSHISN